MEDYKYVGSITEEQNVGMVVQGESIEDTSFWVLQYYGSSEECELHNNGDCSEDEVLWGAGDMGSPVFCTNHYFQDLGCEFYEVTNG